MSREKREQSGARVIRDCIKQRHIFYPEKISIVRSRARVIRDHNRISKYDPQQIKHQIVEGNISVDGQSVFSLHSFYFLQNHFNWNPSLFFGLPIYSNLLYTFSWGLQGTQEPDSSLLLANLVRRLLSQTEYINLRRDILVFLISMV